MTRLAISFLGISAAAILAVALVAGNWWFHHRQPVQPAAADESWLDDFLQPHPAVDLSAPDPLARWVGPAAFVPDLPDDWAVQFDALAVRALADGKFKHTIQMIEATS